MSSINVDFSRRRILSPKAERKLRVARSFLRAGVGVIALRPKSKQPETRFSPQGSKSPTRDLSVVRSWVQRDANINFAGVLLGTPILAIDVDGPEGEAALDELGPLPATRETVTPNGRHLFFNHHGRVKGSRIGFAPKLDIIASGYVVLPGSVHPSGGHYRSEDYDAPIADLPVRAIEIINARRKGEARREGEARTADSKVIAAGSRDNRLTSLAGSFRRQGFEAEVIGTALTAVNDAHCRPPLPQRAVDKIVRSIIRYDAADEGLFETMANVTPREVEFLWEPYLVRGTVNLLEGDPNVGKTYLLCEIAAARSAGRPLPGQRKTQPGNVLFLSAEDDPETTLVHRLIRMGADLERITFLTKFLRLEEEVLEWIEQHILEKHVELVILDPLLAYMQSGIDMNKANETRPFMARLAELARAKNVTIIGLRHLTKSDRDGAIFRGLGSIDITAAARSAVLVGEHPEEPALRAMVHIKHNLSQRGATQLYELTGGNRDRGLVPKVTWRGESDLGPEDFATRRNPPGRPDNESAAAREYLQQVLRAGPKPIATVVSDGEKRGFSSRTLRRVAKEMGIISDRRTWRLAKTSP